jgi:hypothetical protein
VATRHVIVVATRHVIVVATRHVIVVATRHYMYQVKYNGRRVLPDGLRITFFYLGSSPEPSFGQTKK